MTVAVVLLTLHVNLLSARGDEAEVSPEGKASSQAKISTAHPLETQQSPSGPDAEAEDNAGDVDTARVGDADTKVDAEGETPKEFQTVVVRGQVVWLHEALKKRFGMAAVEGAEQQLLALETETGSILPIFEDLRGRSFRKDPRLRDTPIELLVRRYAEHPMLQVIRVYALEKGQKFEVDYWCDVCAIVMFEKDFCACCQDQNRLRKRLVENGVTAERD